MSKLYIYRSFLIMCLAAVAYHWNVAAVLIIVWWILALIGLWAKRNDPSNGQSSAYQIINTNSLGALSAWLVLWNGFYVWKDLDHDYHRRSRD